MTIVKSVKSPSNKNKHSIIGKLLGLFTYPTKMIKKQKKMAHSSTLQKTTRSCSNKSKNQSYLLNPLKGFKGKAFPYKA